MQDTHLQTVIEVLQSIKASEMTPMLQRIYDSAGGSELVDVLMKYLSVRCPLYPVIQHTHLLTHWIRYKGMAGGSASSGGGRTPTRNLTPQATGFSQIGNRPGGTNESTGAGMSVLLSWHEKVVDVAGLGSIQRCMTDWRKV